MCVAGGVGRFDFPGSDGPTLLRSIRQQLLTLPDDYAAPGALITIGRERRSTRICRRAWSICSRAEAWGVGRGARGGHVKDGAGVVGKWGVRRMWYNSVAPVIDPIDRPLGLFTGIDSAPSKNAAGTPDRAGRGRSSGIWRLCRD